MINAIDSNCPIIALNTKFNLEMLENQKFLLFEKNEESISNVLNEFELAKKKMNIPKLIFYLIDSNGIQLLMSIKTYFKN